ncbi:hypothetical protein [Achromobacter xylosoxidans]|uniref:hypothetical protein n=1 Tax=Alcaligenes xylosoxydans xylosoxydans TaxID=85698 RepID=UPI001EEC6024|nr:hypothetical protein [Achromobacter xylosoxidans]
MRSLGARHCVQVVVAAPVHRDRAILDRDLERVVAIAAFVAPLFADTDPVLAARVAQGLEDIVLAAGRVAGHRPAAGRGGAAPRLAFFRHRMVSMGNVFYRR